MLYMRREIGGQDDATHKAHCTKVTGDMKWDVRSPAPTAAEGSVRMTVAELAPCRATAEGEDGGIDGRCAWSPWYGVWQSLCYEE